MLTSKFLALGCACHKAEDVWIQLSPNFYHITLIYNMSIYKHLPCAVIFIGIFQINHFTEVLGSTYCYSSSRERSGDTGWIGSCPSSDNSMWRIGKYIWREFDNIDASYICTKNFQFSLLANVNLPAEFCNSFCIWALDSATQHFTGLPLFTWEGGWSSIHLILCTCKMETVLVSTS